MSSPPIHRTIAADAHKLDAGMGERKVMRKLEGGMELQELKLK